MSASLLAHRRGRGAEGREKWLFAQVRTKERRGKGQSGKFAPREGRTITADSAPASPSKWGPHSASMTHGLNFWPSYDNLGLCFRINCLSLCLFGGKQEERTIVLVVCAGE